jgi:phage tail-like protein
MRPSGPTFWRLGGSTGWQRWTRSADLDVSDAHGLRLASAPAGVLSFVSSDGSLGRLVLPRGMAFDPARTLYLLGPGGASVRRWDPETQSFLDLPEIGGDATGPRRFQNAQNIAIVGRWLYVAVTEPARVLVFDLRSFALVEILSAPNWSPVDLTAHKRGVYVLDATHGSVWRHEPGRSLIRLFHRSDRAGLWSRIIIDRKGRFYLLNESDPSKPVLEFRDPDATPVSGAGAVRDLFDTPLIVADEKGRFALPPSLARVCGRSAPPPRECPPKPRPPHIALTARGAWLLYVLRRAERRVDAYTDAVRLRHSWGTDMDWQPVDIAAAGGQAFVLDERRQAVYRHRAGGENLAPLDLGDTSSQRWSRIACDDRGFVYLYEDGASCVQVFDCSGSPHDEKQYSAVAAWFDAPRPPEPPEPSDRYFDLAGDPVAVDLSEPEGSPLYRQTGTWQSKPFESLIYRCQWHRIELQLSEFPPGSRISIQTCAHEKPEDIDDPFKAHFVDGGVMVAPITQAPCSTPKPADFLVQSGIGQYLTIRLTLEGDGFGTPAVEGARIHYPRDSYVQYLPATYSADDEGRVFLERFLAIFQTEWDSLEKTIAESERYFDPDAVPEGPFLDYLARQWLALSLEGDWTAAQKRRLVSAIPKIYPHRGQPQALRDLLSVYLANLSGLETADVRSLGFPVIVEGFREREFLFASADRASALGHGAPMWSASVKRRLQLDVYATEGETELVSVGDPTHDVFTEFAHKFRVYLPAAWVGTASGEAMIRRALDAEKPAHTEYDLCLVEPRFRVGAQSTIGVDTIVGDAPVWELGRAACVPAPPSLPPVGRLGYDTVLAGPQTPGGAELAPGTTAGKDTVLA